MAGVELRLVMHLLATLLAWGVIPTVALLALRLVRVPDEEVKW